MSNQVQFSTFNFHNSPVRTITDPKGDIWFCGTDVCNILGYVNAPDAMKKHCKEAGIAKRYISYPSGRKEAIFINEPNLYRLIIKSRKPEAERFEAWVFEEVLPQIRKTGSYSQNVEEIQPLVEQPELLSLLVQSYQFLHQAHELRNKANQTAIGAAIDQQLGGYYLYNLGIPLQQHLQKIKGFIHSSNERLMFVEGMLDLLSQPQIQHQPKTQTVNFIRHR